jgi:uncharacterized protein (UPF0303 family)
MIRARYIQASGAVVISSLDQNEAHANVIQNLDHLGIQGKGGD